MKTKVLSRALVAIAVFGLAACDPTETVGSRFVKSERVTASQGASIEIDARESPELAGTVLKIAPGALAADTIITLDLGDSPVVDSAEQSAGPVAIWGPTGTKFSKPVEMTLPFKLTSGQTVSNLFVQVKESDGTRFVIDRSKLTVDEGKGVITFTVTGFTAFQPGSTRTCTANAQCATGLVCVNGTCQTQGACTSNANCAQNQVCLSGSCVACSGGVCPQCSVNADCAAGQSCVSGQCQGTVVDAGPCTSNSHCAAGLICQAGLCIVPGTLLDAGVVCTFGQDWTCNDDPRVSSIWGACTQAGACVCYSGSQLNPQTGRCMASVFDAGLDAGPADGGPSDGGVCRVDLDCPNPGEVCISGTCYGGIFDGGTPDGGQCAVDADCPYPGDVCISGACYGGGSDGGTSDGGMCTVDADCPYPGDVCVAGSCYGGIFDGGSPDGGSSDGGMCAVDADCPYPGDVCIAGTCYGASPDAGSVPPCQSNLDCLSGQVCYSSVCQVIPCSTFRPCPGTFACVAGYCQ